MHPINVPQIWLEKGLGTAIIHLAISAMVFVIVGWGCYLVTAGLATLMRREKGQGLFEVSAWFPSWIFWGIGLLYNLMPSPTPHGPDVVELPPLPDRYMGESLLNSGLEAIFSGVAVWMVAVVVYVVVHLAFERRAKAAGTTFTFENFTPLGWALFFMGVLFQIGGAFQF